MHLISIGIQEIYVGLLIYDILHIYTGCFLISAILGDDSLSKTKEGFSYKHILLHPFLCVS